MTIFTTDLTLWLKFIATLPFLGSEMTVEIFMETAMFDNETKFGFFDSYSTAIIKLKNTLLADSP